MEELLEVVSFHLPRYEQTVKTCQNDPGRVSPSDLTVATKFLATNLFIKVKGSRPMTYQYLTVEMVKEAKANGSFIDQKTFKTAGKYGFDSVILTETSMQILDGYIHFVRLCFGHQKRKPTQQIGQGDEQVGLRRYWHIRSPHALSPNRRNAKSSRA